MESKHFHMEVMIFDFPLLPKQILNLFHLFENELKYNTIKLYLRTIYLIYTNDHCSIGYTFRL